MKPLKPVFLFAFCAGVLLITRNIFWLGDSTLIKLGTDESDQLSESLSTENLMYRKTTMFTKDQLRIIFVTHSRPELVKRCIDSILSQPGTSQYNIMISLDNEDKEQEVLGIISELEIKYPSYKESMKLVIKPKEKRKMTSERAMSSHVHFAMNQLFTGDTQYGMLLEEDLWFSPDFVELMTMSIDVMEKDKTLFCASGWNDNGFLPFAADEKKLLRTKGFPGYGWIISRKHITPFLAKLPNSVRNWGAWLDHYVIDHNLECIVPEVPRTRHLGAGGVHISDNTYYDSMTFAKSESGQGTFDDSITRLTIEEFNKDLLKRAKEAVKVDLNEIIDPEKFNFTPNTEYIVQVNFNSDCPRLVEPFKLFHIRRCKMTHEGVLQVSMPHKQSRILFVDSELGSKWLKSHSLFW